MVSFILWLVLSVIVAAVIFKAFGIYVLILFEFKDAKTFFVRGSAFIVGVALFVSAILFWMAFLVGKECFTKLLEVSHALG